MFDMQFDLATNDKMYCSEFVYKAIEAGYRRYNKISYTPL